MKVRANAIFNRPSACRRLFIAGILLFSLAACDFRYEPEIPAEPAQPQAGINEPPAANAELSGEALFIACQGCHSIQEGAAHQVGPNLYGIIGQPAASRPDYTYSEALKNSGITWTAANLTVWIVATEAMVPGNWMSYSNIIEPDEVQRLVGYIVTTSGASESDDSP